MTAIVAERLVKHFAGDIRANLDRLEWRRQTVEDFLAGSEPREARLDDLLERLLHRCIACCGNYLSGMRAWSQSPMREAEGLSRLHNTITDWPDSGYTRRIAFIPGAPPPWP
jgi:hypothetical protein